MKTASQSTALIGMNADGFGHGWAEMPHKSPLFCVDVGNSTFCVADSEGGYQF